MRSLMIITRYFSPVRNGLADHTMLLLNCLRSDFDKLIIVYEAHDTEKSPRERNTSEGGVVRYVQFRGLKELHSVVFDSIRNHQPDAVLLQYLPHMWGRGGLAPNIIVLITQIRMRTKVPVITFAHELYYDWSWSPKRSALSVVHRTQLLVIGFLSKQIIVTNQIRHRLLSRVWGQKVARIPAGNVSARKSDELRFTPFPWPYVLWFGTLSDGQLLEELCVSFSLIASRFPTLRLVLVGGFDVSGPRITKLRELFQDADIASRVMVYGFVEDDELSDMLSGSTVNVHVNHSGPSGRRTVVAAYLRAARPMVCVDGRETDPEFRHMENVILVPPGDPGKLADALEVVLKQESMADRLAAAARSLFNERYADDAIRAMVLAEINEVLRNGTGKVAIGSTRARP